MPLFVKPAKAGRAGYRVQVGRTGVQLSIDENFWNDTVISTRDGTTQLDFNIAQVLQEIRAALYYVATGDLPKH